MCMADGDVHNDVARTEYHRAAKVHRCDECGRPIEAGERYRLDVSLSDGWWYRNKTCAHCDVGRAWLAEECRSWYFGMVAEDIQEHWDESDLLRSVQMRLWLVGHARRWRRRDGRLWRIPARIPVPVPA